ncbi:MAG: TonB-dependent receptor [Bacteroidia bacterium]|nr:TonB-dependent receptor [Bacteroidia bacterium]
MKKYTYIISACLLYWNSSNAQNDTTIVKLINLEEVVFSANKAEEKKSDVPYSIEVIKAKAIEFSNSQTTADVISNTGNIMVQKSQGGGGSPIIRGFEASRVLMVIDGVRLNNAVYRTGHLQNIITIDNAILERTEVIYGPSSVMYGSDALGGVMHFYTKNPLFGDEKMNLKLNSYLRYGSANNEMVGHVDFNVGFKKLASLTSITYSKFDDLRTGYSRNPNPDFGRCYYYSDRNWNNTADSMVRNVNSNIQKKSGYSQMDIMEKLLYKANENVNIGLNIQYSTSSDINRYDRLSEYAGGTLRFAEWYYGPQNRLLASLYSTIKSDGKLFDNLRITAAAQNIDESRINRRFNNNNKRYQIENIKVYSLNADFRKQVKEKHELSYGVEFLYNDVTSTAKSVNILTDIESPWNTRYPDGGSSMMTEAVYLTHSWEISDKIIFSDGLRFSNNSIKANFVDTTFFPFPFKNTKQNNNALNGNMGLVISPEKNVRFSLLGSTGYRSPNIDDLTKIFESTGGILIIPNEKLKPEYAYNGEVGFEILAFDNKVKFEGNYYYTLLKNAIVTKKATYNGQDSIFYNGTFSQVQSQQNAERATVQGIYGAISSDLNDYASFKTSLTYTLGNYYQKVPGFGGIGEHDSIIPLDHIPPMFGQTSLNLHFKKFEGEIYARYSANKALKDYSPSGEDNLAQATPNGMPGWVTFNIKTMYKVNKNFSVNLGIENLFDTHYRIFASGISAPGRNIFLTLRVKV